MSDSTKVSHETRSMDEAKQRAEISHDIVADRLRIFVRRWAPGPSNYRERDEFQMDLMRLLADCMRHQGNTLDYGIERFATIAFAHPFHEQAMSALADGIFKEKKPNGDR